MSEGRTVAARERALAAAAHLGVYAAFPLGYLYAAVGYHPFARLPHDFDALALAALCSVAVPVQLALAARRWRSAFLWSHAARAALFQLVSWVALPAAIALCATVETYVGYRAAEALAALLAVPMVLVWICLPMGAAFRAKDGDPAWYPLVDRLVYGRPGERWRRRR